MTVALTPLDDAGLAELAATVVTDTRPGETMPTRATAWDERVVEEFVAFHRRRRGGLGGPEREVNYVIRVQERAHGVVRLQQQSPGVLELGIWLARSARGRGIGRRAVVAAIEQARGLGARAVVANTTSGNAAAIAVLRGLGADITYAPMVKVQAVINL